MKRFLLGTVLLAISTGCTSILREHKEAATVPLENVEISSISDGVYEGAYAGGMYGWRENRVSVKIVSGRVVEINLLYSKEIDAGDSVYTHLVKRVLERQSLDIDALTGATLTTRAHLKAIESALLSAARDTTRNVTK